MDGLIFFSVGFWKEQHVRPPSALDTGGAFSCPGVLTVTGMGVFCVTSTGLRGRTAGSFDLSTPGTCSNHLQHEIRDFDIACVAHTHPRTPNRARAQTRRDFIPQLSLGQKNLELCNHPKLVSSHRRLHPWLAQWSAAGHAPCYLLPR